MRAKKSLGQNFLQDSNVIDRIVGALDLSANDIVIEIGAGRGALTEKLMEHKARVIAIEFDRDMVALLRRQFGRDLQIIEGDVLDIDFHQLTKGNTKLVGNLPYNISTPILQKLGDCRGLFSSLVLMFQREVVDRITAKAGSSDRGYLSVLVEAVFDVERLFEVSPQAFRPVPKVWSAVVRLSPKKYGITDSEGFRRVVSIGFGQKRKTILNNLKTQIENAAELLDAVSIDPIRRAETISLEEWIRVAEMASVKSGPGI